MLPFQLHIEIGECTLQQQQKSYLDKTLCDTSIHRLQRCEDKREYDCGKTMNAGDDLMD